MNRYWQRADGRPLAVPSGARVCDPQQLTNARTFRTIKTLLAEERSEHRRCGIYVAHDPIIYLSSVRSGIIWLRSMT